MEQQSISLIRLNVGAWGTEEFLLWQKVNDIMKEHFSKTKAWDLHGYDGISKVCEKEFGVKVIRSKTSHVIFEMSEETLTLLLLKYDQSRNME